MSERQPHDPAVHADRPILARPPAAGGQIECRSAPPKESRISRTAPTGRGATLLIIAICLVSLVVKLVYIGAVVPEYKPAAVYSAENHGFISFGDFGMQGDEGGYVWIAYNLLKHGQFSTNRSLPLLSTAYRGPGFPFLVAGIFTVFGFGLWPTLIVEAVLMCTVPALVYWLSLLVLQKRNIALTACILAAVHPAALFFGSGNIVSESLYVPLLTLSVCWLVLARKTFKNRHAFLAGAALGLAAITRSEALGIGFLGAIWLVLCARSARRAIILVAVLMVAFVAVLLPWIVRNALVFDRFVAGTTQAGPAFLGANNRQVVDQLPGTWMRIPPELQAELKGLPEPEALVGEVRLGFRELRRMGLKRLLKLEAFKLARYLVPAQRVFPGTGLRSALFEGGEITTFSVASLITVLLVPVTCGIAVAVLVGIRTLLRHALRGDCVATLLLLVQAYYLLVVLIFFGDGRFRFAVEPQLCIFAAAGMLPILSALIHKFRDLSFFRNRR